VKGEPERYHIVTFEGAFHGRTLATLAAGGQQKYLDGFGPKVEGFEQVPVEDEKALAAAITPETGALMIEPIQGEGGVRPISAAFLRHLRKLCDERGMLLIFDEIQCGYGRTGKFFAYEHAGITPDIMSVAKGIGGGFPLGACLATREAAVGMTLATHGSTYGGNPLAMSIGNAVLDIMLEPEFLDRVSRTGLILKQRLAELKDRHAAVIEEVRGEGLMLGLKMKVPNGDLVAAARAEKLLVIAAGDNVVRLVPPLIVDETDVREAVERLDVACTHLEHNLALTTAKGAAE
jgi:acetylornithine/N-succinyldiaminopimelate aminotransferase